ncbi:MAG: VCBS repeat-containing protein, partial [Verrucomicrobia bacterium]|nr:VCBS repeat-containing protein [Verrucomicrobiota bacterium]
MHTNFKLSSRGEVLSLHRPGDGGFQSFPPPGAPRARLLTDSPLGIVDYGFAATTALTDDTNAKWDWLRIENRSGAVIPHGSWGISSSDRFGGFSWMPESPSPLAPGESITVFFSGRNIKDRLGNLHAPFGLSLLNLVIAITDAEGRPFHRLDWTGVGFEFPEQISNISFGINQSGAFHYFDQPTPGWMNSAGVESLRELPSEAGAEVRFEQAANGQTIVRVTLLTSDPLLDIERLWFCYDTSTGEERHAVMLRELDVNGANQGNTYTVPVPEGYSDGAGYRIMAAAIDLGNQQDEVTLELARGGASSRNDVPVQPGGLRVAAIIPGQSARALDVGAILLPASEGVLDLVTANRDSGNLEVRRGTARSGRFAHSATQVVRVPGGPRSVKIVDLNGDGWNDVVVVLRNFDRIVVYKNSDGILKLASEVPTGVSPREVAVADFNGDGQPDAAAINRFSSDVSIVPTFPGTQSLATLDQIYETDGEVVALTVIDLNADGRDDVVQLHRASSDISIRTADATGRLSEPEFFPIGTSPSAVELIDVNRDGLLDLVTANLDAIGSISVRRATATGYALEEIFQLPDDARGGLFALEAADFNGDGITDLAAGYFDCRLALYQGTGTGTFEYVRTTEFTYESRVMTTGDFDRDGDIDLAGAGYAGDVVVFENRGNLLTDANAPRWDYSPRSAEKFGTREISAVDFDGDGDLDLLLGSGSGAMVYPGIEGMLFRPNATAIQGTDYPTAGAVTGDFDGDGVDDIAVSCRLLSCVSVLRGDGAGNFRVGLSVDVPAGAYLAAGDLDGDGKTDLVGAGDVLWTALSSRKSQAVAAAPEKATRTSNPGIVINEILAINND